MTFEEAIQHEEQIINEHKFIKRCLYELKSYWKNNEHCCELCQYDKPETKNICDTCKHNFADKFTLRKR